VNKNRAMVLPQIWGNSKSIFKFFKDIAEMLRLKTSENKIFSSYNHFPMS